MSRKLLPVFLFYIVPSLFFAFLFYPDSVSSIVSLKMMTLLVVMVRLQVFVRLKIREL